MWQGIAAYHQGLGIGLAGGEIPVEVIDGVEGLVRHHGQDGDASGVAGDGVAEAERPCLLGAGTDLVAEGLDLYLQLFRVRDGLDGDGAVGRLEIVDADEGYEHLLAILGRGYFNLYVSAVGVDPLGGDEGSVGDYLAEQGAAEAVADSDFYLRCVGRGGN